MTSSNDIPARPRTHRIGRTRSHYLQMRDGVRIAIDITLPSSEAFDRVPTIVRQTRYHRRFRYQKLLNNDLVRQVFEGEHAARSYFVSRGYAWVDVCARGSGASGGVRTSPWSLDERDDALEILEWILHQPWSNGRIGARGVSYDGTASEFLLWHRHPAVRAIAPRFALYDVFEDVAMPGGIHLEHFTEQWSRLNRSLDADRIDLVLEMLLGGSRAGFQQLADSSYGRPSDRAVAQALRLYRLTASAAARGVAGVAPVDDDPRGELVREHIEQRTENVDVHEAAQAMTYRGETGLSQKYPDLDIDEFSPHAHLDRLRGTAAIYNYSGWFDGAYQRAATKRFHAHDDPGHRLIIGPWEHGGRQNVSPWQASRSSLYDHEADLLAFFDAHLWDDAERAEPWNDVPRVRYFTMGAERWQSAPTWPPPGARPHRLHLTSDGTLATDPDAHPSTARIGVRNRHGSGKASRWRSLLRMLPPVHYTPRQGEGVVCHTSAPLPHAMEVTGHVLVHVEMTSTTDDPRLFAYLEDVAPDGTVHYVTEGQLRAIHREVQEDAPASHAAIPYRTYRREHHRDAPPGELLQLEFDLLPTSYLFQRGHAIRLCLTGEDIDHFERGPVATHTVRRHRSWIELPVVPS